MKGYVKLLMLIYLLAACSGTSSDKSANQASVSSLAIAPISAFSPAIAVNTNGKAIAAWSEGSPPSLWINSYNPASGWGRAERVGAMTGLESGARIALNSTGDAVLAWVHVVSNSVELLAATYNPTTGWSQPTQLDGNTVTSGSNFWVSVDDSGSASVFWQGAMSAGSNTVFYSKHSSNGWSTPETVVSETSTFQQMAATSPSGKTFVIYNQSKPDADDIFSHFYNTYVRSFSPGSGWGTPQAVGNKVSEMNGSSYLNPTTTPGHYEPTISVDGQGNALALWSEVYFLGDNYKITVNGFNTVTGWGTAQRIGEIGSNSTLTVSAFASDASGTSYIGLVDCQYSFGSTAHSNIHVAKLKEGTWSIDKVVDSLPYYALEPAVTAGKTGVLLTWLQIENNTFHLWMKAYNPLSGWGPASRVDTLTASVSNYQTARDGSGGIYLIWTQGDEATSGVYAKILK